MQKTLAIATLALGLLAFGCDDDDDARPTDGGRPDVAAETGTSLDTGATTDTPRTDVPVSTADGGDAARPDGGADATVEAGSEAGASEAGADAPTLGACQTPTTMTGVLTDAFCAYVLATCGTGTSPDRFTDLAACKAKYDSLDATKKSCVAYHVCVAGSPATGADPNANKTLHCPHPSGGGGNPCGI